jgi:hypothetical protein
MSEAYIHPDPQDKAEDEQAEHKLEEALPGPLDTKYASE